MGQNLLCRFTAGKAGLVCWEPPGLGFNSAELTRGWPGPGLSVAEPSGAIPLLCTKFGFNLKIAGLLSCGFGLRAPASLGGRFGLSAPASPGGKCGLSAPASLGGRFGLSVFGL